MTMRSGRRRKRRVGTPGRQGDEKVGGVVPC
jgi:hypothetical protein